MEKVGHHHIVVTACTNTNISSEHFASSEKSKLEFVYVVTGAAPLVAGAACSQYKMGECTESNCLLFPGK